MLQNQHACAPRFEDVGNEGGRLSIHVFAQRRVVTLAFLRIAAGADARIVQARAAAVCVLPMPGVP